MTRRLLAITSVGEAATGLVLLVFPRMTIDLLFGASPNDAGVAISRICGFSLIALGVACWPGDQRSPAIAGMLGYTAPVALYLLYLGVAGTWRGMLLWPAIVVHLLLTLLLIRAWLQQPRGPA